DFPGDNLFGGGGLNWFSIDTLNLLTGPGNDIFNVLGTDHETANQISAGGGADTFNVGTSYHHLNHVQGPLTVNGQGQPLGATDVMNIQDDAATASQSYVVSATTIDRSGAALITYGGLESLIVNAGPFDDVFTVTGTAVGTPVTLNEGAGRDTTDLGNSAGVLDGFLSPIAVNGQAGADALLIPDRATPVGMSD